MGRGSSLTEKSVERLHPLFRFEHYYGKCTIAAQVFLLKNEIDHLFLAW